jgi:fatty-acyl-CoA synthase
MEAVMLGQMMDHPLLISALLEYAARYHGDTEIVSRTHDHPLHRTTYAATHERALRLAAALERLGVGRGDRVATLAWNDFRHFELYFAVSGMGAVCHTLNPRLFRDQLAYVVNHAEDAWIAVDPAFVPILEALAPEIPGVRGFLVLSDRAHMPASGLRDTLCYEELLEAETAGFAWPAFDERTASSLCYTSGTTGHPKGVLYSHRSTVLHSFAVCLTDTLALSSRDAVLPVVPMFHANAWGLPYAAPLCGAKLVFPGPKLDGRSVYELLDGESVSFTAGVPTVWLGLLQYLAASGLRLDKLERVVIGGSAAARSMIEAFERDHGVTVIHAWGMTELSPLGTVGTLKRKHLDLPERERHDLQVKQGRGIFGVDLKIVGDGGRELPRDGRAFGELMTRGPWTVESYFKGEGGRILSDDGWFPTGDVATLDPEGFMQITDRSKDVIKSGGEWISSIDLENEALAHPSVVEAAVIGVAHPKWDERPLLIVVPAAGAEPSREELLAFLEGRVAKWWLPDDVAFVEELPHTATGKISKKTLRDQFRNYSLPKRE